MIRGLQLFILLKKTSSAFSYTGIRDKSGLRTFSRKVVRLPNEPGIRIRKNILEEDSDYDDEIYHDHDEHDLDDDLDMMKVDKLYDHAVREDKKFKKKVQLKITADKFFKEKPQPQMLTYNERLCIKHLHQQDPVQWDFKTLSESFPATVDTIRKILKSKRKITPERAQKMDSIVQRNWKLLSEDKLKADPHVIEHLKKFVNRREVLLGQLKNEKFYLPEIKDETVWNQGEISSILVGYEKTIEKLAEKNSPKALSGNEKEGEKSSLDLVKKQIKAEAEKLPKTKDSFRFGEMIKSYQKQTTLEELENNILKKANRRKNLELSEKAILENKLGSKKEVSENLELFTPPFTQEVPKSLRTGRKSRKKSDNVINSEIYEEEVEGNEFSPFLDDIPPDENTYFGEETHVGKILQKLKNKEVKMKKEEVVVKKEKKIENFSDSERLQREKIYFDNEVQTIKETAFWNNKKSSREKALAEALKPDLDGPNESKNWKKIFVLDPDPYPERIKIPKNKQGSGMTFRVKDCYYDDDGEFLYRVPGMTK